MKKRLLVAALIVAFVATGCGGKADDSATGSSTTTTAGSVTASSVPAADGVAGGADTGSSDSNACTRALAASTAFVLGVQLLASMNSPEAVVAVKSHTMGNLDLNQMEGSFEVYVPYSRILIIAVAVVLMIALTLYIQHSRMGRASRACSQDMHMANLLGIDTNRVISFTFILGAMLAAVGGVLIALAVGKLNPFIGFIAGIKAFTAAVLGGIGSIPGAMLGGVILGVAETFAAAYISSEYKDIVAFGLLVLILLVRPTGLLGKPEVEKV